MRITLGGKYPVDFCADCFLSKEDASESYGSLLSYDDDHPHYEDIEYICAECGKPLSYLDE